MNSNLSGSSRRSSSNKNKNNRRSSSRSIGSTNISPSTGSSSIRSMNSVTTMQTYTNPKVLQLLGGAKRDKKRTEYEINEASTIIPKESRYVYLLIRRV